MSTDDLAHVLAALSARMSVLEVALGAIVPSGSEPRARVLRNYSQATAELVERYLSLAVEDTYIELLRGSIADLGSMFETDSDAVEPATQRLNLCLTRDH